MVQVQTINTSLTSDTISKLAEVAENQNRSSSDIIQEAVDGYLNALAWLEAKIKKADEGPFIPHDEVRERLRKLGVKCE
jgi:predicted transcriptional regulator